jgi:predicted amidohydrolase
MIVNAVVAQFPVSLSIQKNLESIHSILLQTRPGDLVVLPEGALSGYATDTSFLEHIDNTELMASKSHLQAEVVARKINLWVGACVNQNGQWFNAAWGFFADGRTAVYHKINLATHERGIFATGNRLPVFEMETPDGNVTLGVQICRELRFPEQWRWLAKQGAQIFLHLNNATGVTHPQPVWRSFLVSRAAENQRFVLSANNAASKQICPTIAVAPDGQVMDEIVSANPNILRLELDLSKISDLYLDQCRNDVIAVQSTQPNNT